MEDLEQKQRLSLFKGKSNYHVTCVMRSVSVVALGGAIIIKIVT